MKVCTQNLADWSLRLDHGLRAVIRWTFGWRALATWTPRLLALLVALELGLLSPLSCVIHCFVQQLLAERPAIGLFLCGEHSLASAIAPAAPFAGLSPRATPDPTSSPVSTITPRALYEFVVLVSPLLAAVSMLLAMLLLPPTHRLVAQTLSPPNPPPRLLPA